MALPNALYLGKMTYDHYVGLKDVANEAVAHLTPPERPDVIHAEPYRELGDMRALAAMGTGFYDMAHAGPHMRRPEHHYRREAGELNTQLQMWAKVIDTAIDRPERHRTRYDTDLFLGRCVSSLVSKARYEPAGDFAPSLQRAALDLAGYLRGRMSLHERSAERHNLEAVGHDLRQAALEQLDTSNPTQLLQIARRIGAGCGSMAGIVAEYVDNTAYPEIREASAHFGSASIITDHWAGLIHDLGEGSNTYATATVRQQGGDSTVLKELKTMALDVAADEYRQGIDALYTRKQRGIYQTLQWLVWEFNMKKKSATVTPANVAAALAAESR